MNLPNAIQATDCQKLSLSQPATVHSGSPTTGRNEKKSAFGPSRSNQRRNNQQQKSHPNRGGFLALRLDHCWCTNANQWMENGDGWDEYFTWHRPIFSGGYPPNIVGAAAFHSRVRDGSEWFHCAMDTRIEQSLLSGLNPENCIGYRLSPALDDKVSASRAVHSVNMRLVKPSVY